MSIIRCVIGDHNVDSDYHEICMVDGLECCFDCYDKENDKNNN